MLAGSLQRIGSAVVDGRPLSVEGELFALINRLATFDLIWCADHYELHLRHSEEISGWPPGSRVFVDVVAEHRCALAYPNGSTLAFVDRQQRYAPLPDTPPF